MKNIFIIFIILFSFIGNASTELDIGSLTAHKASGGFDDLNLEDLPVWDKYKLLDRFREIRDKKFLTFNDEPRRIPWLYAKDGCHTRSTLFNREAERLGYEKPKKVFIFGSLQILSPLLTGGAVEPWFHAAPIIKVDGKPVVLDPSISYSKPLPLETWISRITKDKNNIVFSICSSETYLPFSKCNNPEPLDIKKLNEDTEFYLMHETRRLNYLGLNEL